jgi:hypothetical protein
VDCGPNPVDLASIEIPEALKFAYNEVSESLFLADSGYYETDKRILIFGTHANIELLKTCETWYGDGTFSVSPSIFYQMYTINVIYRGKNIPCIYALLADKEEVTYSKMFAIITQFFKTGEFPKNFCSDYEKAVLNAIKTNFPNFSIYGCYFHFAQALWRQMQKKTLSKIC